MDCLHLGAKLIIIGIRTQGVIIQIRMAHLGGTLIAFFHFLIDATLGLSASNSKGAGGYLFFLSHQPLDQWA